MSVISVLDIFAMKFTFYYLLKFTVSHTDVLYISVAVFWQQVKQVASGMNKSASEIIICFWSES